MNWLNAIPEADRAGIRKNLFASEEFFEAVRNAIFGSEYLKPGETTPFYHESHFVLDGAFARHGFKQPHSATSVTHNIMAENTERDRHAARMLALSGLLERAKVSAKKGQQRLCLDSQETIKLELAIAAVEREFKP